MKKVKNEPKARQIVLKAFKSFEETKDRRKLMEEVSEALKFMDIQKFALVSGIPRTSIYKLFSKKGRPSFDYMYMFLDYLRIKIELTNRRIYENRIQADTIQ